MVYEEAKAYVKSYMKKLTAFSPEDNGVHIGLPHHFLQPNHEIFDADMFYWDSFFISLGLLLEQENIDLVKGIIDNFRFLQNKYGIIPARNKYYNLGISQPPFLSTLVRIIFDMTQDRSWLEEQLPMLEKELNEYWMGKNVEFHLLENGLSRYCDHNITHQTAEHESGWDMTSRFLDKCLDYAPIDLNCCLYKYEVDLAYFYEILGNVDMSHHYDDMAIQRRSRINEYCWDEEKGFFFDYNHLEQKKSEFYSLAGFFPLWCGLANWDQAERMVEKLSLFECEGGLSTTQKEQLLDPYRQWDHPNGWANLQWIVIVGLEHYQYDDDAKRIAQKWLSLNNHVFELTGKFWEKYDVVEMNVGKPGRYPTQEGFGWSNAVFLWLATKYS